MKNIIETLQDSGNFTTFLNLIQVAGMESVLREQGPFTVFAPTDEAFSRVPKERMDAISEDPDMIVLIMSYHIVPGRLTSDDLRCVTAIRSNLGTDLVIRPSDGNVTINSVPIVEADTFCTNGVYHVINATLVPPLN